MCTSDKGNCLFIKKSKVKSKLEISFHISIKEEMSSLLVMLIPLSLIENYITLLESNQKSQEQDSKIISATVAHHPPLPPSIIKLSLLSSQIRLKNHSFIKE